MKENKLIDLSMDFAIKILSFTENVKGHSSLTNQLERSGTSIGANIREANYAHGKADFVAKMQISLKECYETEYWLDIFCEAKILKQEEHKRLHTQCSKIRKILTASITTAKKNAAKDDL